ncbi:hypothetical protein BBJ28_00002705 [Nothophytophthora sp. Chile5]|nr:hypothetical protein BBJ28_00002705 [Nothophytophthora sp. Chile5]
MEKTSENRTNDAAAPDPAHETAKETATGAAIGAGVGMGLWGLAMPVANFIGFGVNGIAAGSTAASMMSAAAVANGGGVAAGSTVAVLQGVGAVGLASSVGLGLVAVGVATGGVAVGIKTLLSKRKSVVEGEETLKDTNEEIKEKEDTTEKKGTETNETSSWLLLEWLFATADPVQTRFAGECEAREAYKKSSTAKKILFSSDMTCVECSG